MSRQLSNLDIDFGGQEELSEQDLEEEDKGHKEDETLEISFAMPNGRKPFSIKLNVRLIKLIRKLSVYSLTFSSRLCQIDIWSAHNTTSDDADQLLERERPKLAAWPKWIFCANVYWTSKLIANIVYQYEHDFYLIKLKHFNSSFPQLNDDHLEYYEEKLNESRATLKLIGAPHIQGSITIECVYITFLMLSFASYLLGMLYFRFIVKFDFFLLRAILDERRELSYFRRRLLLGVVNKFIESSRNFTRAAIDQSGSKSPVLSHKLLVRQLRLMAKRGQLMPANRLHSWHNRMLLVFFLFNYGSLIWGHCFNVFLYNVLPKLAEFKIEHESSVDWLFELDLALMSVVITVSLCFYLSACIISCLDQASLISHTHKLIIKCRHENCQLYICSTKITASGLSMQTGSGGLWNQKICRAQMNANLLSAIMHYKIFVVQLRPILTPVGFVLIVSIATMISHSLIIRLHTPYVSNVELKSSYYIISLITLFFVNFNILPICSINSRCVNLYRALSSLLAHSIEVDRAEEDRRRRAAKRRQKQDQEQQQRKSTFMVPLLSSDQATSLYDAHTIWMLRSELQWSERFVKQFETRSLGFTFTYSSMLRVYIYLGAIVLSIMFESRARAALETAAATDGVDTLSSFRHFMDDPFGLYEGPRAKT